MVSPCTLSLVWKLFCHSVKIITLGSHLTFFLLWSKIRSWFLQLCLFCISTHSWCEFLSLLLPSFKMQNSEHFGLLYQIAFERSLLPNITYSKLKSCVLLLFRSGNVKDGSLVACAFSPNGSFFVTGSSCGDLTFWDDKMRCLYNEKAHDLGVTCCDISSQPISG